MRTCFTVVLFSLSSIWLYAETHTVFELEGLYGLKNDKGETVIPPLYEKLGWSDGTESVHQGVIGVRENNLWGLISIKNKPFTEIKYHSLDCFSETSFKASVKGKFSNELFYGLLDKNGRITVSFNYSSIQVLSDLYLVSKFDSRDIKFGLISTEEEVQIQLKYQSITQDKNFYLGVSISGETDIYTKKPKLITTNIDSIKYNERGIKCYRQGFVGFYSFSGELVEDFIHKEIVLSDGVLLPHSFARWDVFEGMEKVLSFEADSLHLAAESLWIAYNNGAQHFSLSDSLFRNNQYRIQTVLGDRFIVKNNQSGLWSVLGAGGREIVAGYDSIIGNDNIYWGKNREGWTLLGRNGSRRLRVDDLRKGIGGQFLCGNGKYWGIYNQYGLEATPLKYDSIIANKDNYDIYYLNRWGIMNTDGNWELRPEFTEVYSFKEYYIGKVGYAYAYKVGEFTWKSTSKPIGLLRDTYLIFEDEEGNKGLLDKSLNMVVNPAYDSIHALGNFFILKKNNKCIIVNEVGNRIVQEEEAIQEVKDLREDFFLIKKDNRWGFLDTQGRMRISNRYEEANVFSEGLAPIKLRGKWGFVDKEERLIIQPYYEEVSAFRNKISIVKIGKRKGLIDPAGIEIIDINWEEISMTPNGNFIVKDRANNYGLLSKEGHFLLRSGYQLIEDIAGGVIVMKNGNKGVLEYSGKERFMIKYDEIKTTGKYVLLKH